MQRLKIIILGLALIQTAIAHSIDYKTIDVLDSHIAYREGGRGDTVLFIHDVPTSSFLWRKVLPKISQTHRVIAIDLIGHGRSGKPFIEYRLNDHLRYLKAFIEKPKLMWPREVPIAGVPADNRALFMEYSQYLMTSFVAKLLLYSTPGVLTGENEIFFIEQNFPNVSTVHVGEGLHFIQEEHPETVTNEIIQWLQDITEDSLL